MQALISVVAAIIIGGVGIGALYYGPGVLHSHLGRKRLKTVVNSRQLLLLTFDDGPGRTLTPEVLNLLRRCGVSATFFLLGRNVQGNEDILRQMAREGHEIAVHGYDHVNALRVTPWKAIENIRRGLDAVEAVLGKRQHPLCYRPVQGKLNAVVLLYLWVRRMPIVYWTLDSRDSWELSRRPVLNTVGKVEPAVILMHDYERRIKANYDYVLGYLTRVLQNRGNVQVVTTSEMLNRNGHG